MEFKEEFAQAAPATLLQSDFREIVHSICEARRIPVLVTDLIAEYLDSRDLPIISTLSQKLRTQANQLIYRDVVLDFTDTERCGRTSCLLLRTLLTNSTSASAIRSLSLVGCPLREWRRANVVDSPVQEKYYHLRVAPEVPLDLTGFNSREIARCHELSQTSGPRIGMQLLCLTILVLATNVHYLYIGSDYFRYPDFRKGFGDIFKAGGFRYLQHSNLCIDIRDDMSRYIYTARHWEHAMLAPLHAPNIQSMTVVTTLEPDEVWRLRTSSLTRLILHHCQIRISNLSPMLAATPRLRYLEYHASVDSQWWKEKVVHWNDGPRRPLVELQPLFAALPHVSDTLEELVASQLFECADVSYDETHDDDEKLPFNQPIELLQMKKLHTLRIPYISLLDTIPGTVERPKWDDILPASLRQITLTDDGTDVLWETWTDQQLTPVFTELLDWLATREAGLVVPAFNLRMGCLDGGDHFNESLQRALATLCEERGIHCTIWRDGARCPWFKGVNYTSYTAPR